MRSCQGIGVRPKLPGDYLLAVKAKCNIISFYLIDNNINYILYTIIYIITYNNHVQANNRIPSSAPVAVPEEKEAPVGSDAEYDFLFRGDPDGPLAAVPEPL